MRRAVVRTGLVVLLQAVACGTPVHAGPLDWLRGLFHRPQHAPARVATQNDGPVPLRVGKPLQIRLGAAAPSADLPGGTSHYLRFTLGKALPAAVVRVRVLTQHHERSPRFTALPPTLHLLDAAGNIRKSMAIQPLHLAIDPFQPAELRGCLRVENLHSFLLGVDNGRVGDSYSYNARTRGGSYPDHGYYRSGAPIRVYLTYAAVGELVLRVTPVTAGHPACNQWQG